MTAHPAKFTDVILERIDDMVADRYQNPFVLDPFAGTGKIHNLTSVHAVGVEIEPEWATITPGNLIADTQRLPFKAACFDGVISSPCYGNRHADHHKARDKSRRHSYTHTLGRTLHAANAGTLHWGPAYRDFHDRAWTECLRVLRPGGFVMINASNHIRRGVEQPVVEWHLAWFLSHRCHFLEIDTVETPRLRAGANHDARVAHEHIFHVAKEAA